MPEPGGHNNSRFAAYQAVIPGPDGRAAMLACAWVMLPSSLGDVVSCVVDLRVDFDAVRPSPPGPAHVPADLKVTCGELADFFAKAWHLAMVVLPLAAAVSPAELPPAGAPRVELHIQNERPVLSGGPRSLRLLDMIDLSDYGQPRGDRLDSLAVGVTVPVGLPDGRITALVNDGMTRMAEDSGFTGIHAAVLNAR